jgi:hypothetical protein
VTPLAALILYAVAGLLTAVVVSAKGGEFEEPGITLAFILLAWPLAALLGTLHLVFCVLDVVAKLIGFKRAASSEFYY